MKPTEDEFFKDLISQSKLDIPSPDFEEQVMIHIKKEGIYRRQLLRREVTRSWVLIAIIVALGTGLSLMLSQLQTFYFGIPLRMVKMMFEFLFIVFVLLQMDTLIKYTFRRDETRLINQLRNLTQDLG